MRGDQQVARMSAAICGIKMKEAPGIALLIRATLARGAVPHAAAL
jgi:hypothetical protein